jgi:NhaC family Na+:H+ antiporter
MTLIFATVFAVVLLMFKGVKLSFIEEGVIHGCKTATVSMMILMFIGVMIPRG